MSINSTVYRFTSLIMDEIVLEEDFPLVEGIPTCVIKCGELQPNKPLILIIPGNPGVATYYEEFMLSLYSKFHRTLPVWCVSHAGHVLPVNSIPQDSERSTDLFSIHGQVRHKFSFIKENIPAETPLILIGHSIGCYIILHLLDLLHPTRVKQCCLLFPTVERMATSPNGLRATPLLGSTFIRGFAAAVCAPIYYFMPKFMREYLVNLYFKGKVAACAIGATANFISPFSVSCSLYMAHTEMLDVSGDADHSIIDSYAEKLMFYYGTVDKWCPKQYCKDMKARHSNVDITLCDRELEHAFVLKSSDEMAGILYTYLSKKFPKMFKLPRS